MQIEKREGLGDLSKCGVVHEVDRWGGGRLSRALLVMSVQGLEARVFARQRQYSLLYTQAPLLVCVYLLFQAFCILTLEAITYFYISLVPRPLPRKAERVWCSE